MDDFDESLMDLNKQIIFSQFSDETSWKKVNDNTYHIIAIYLRTNVVIDDAKSEFG